ncbi:MAG: hypothetical protein JWQ45_1759 [Blastococcus sp.]|nr:hypothetical protein [Blastococcus sp.]
MGVRAEAQAVDAGNAEEAVVRESVPGEYLTGEFLAPLRRTNVSGDLEDLLDHRPFFRTRWRGYDRLQVDNYTTWVETELAAARRQNTHLLNRYGQCAVELEHLRRAPRARRSPELTPVTERLGELLRLAAEEAAEITAAGVDEAERIVAEARTEAEARLQKVTAMREAVVVAGEEVRRNRSEASGILARARAKAAEVLRKAAAERERLAGEAATQRQRLAGEAAAQLAVVQAEVDDLRRQRDEARESLRRLTARIGEALEAAAAVVPAEVSVLAERRGPLATSAS